MVGTAVSELPGSAGIATYRERGTNVEGRRWPDLGRDLIVELRRHPGRTAVMQANEFATEAAGRLAALVDQRPLQVGAALAMRVDTVDQDRVVDLLAGSFVLTEIDALFWRPRFGLDVLRLLRLVARRKFGVVSVWPGHIGDREVRYSEPGRADYYRQSLSDALVLTPVPTAFDDDSPFEIKRIP